MGAFDNSDDAPWMNEIMPSADWTATQNYTQNYSYDLAGNMTQLQHVATSGSYTRNYSVNTTNNRLDGTSVGAPSNPPPIDIYNYSYDALGNLLNMPHLNAMDYNWQNMLAHIQRGTDDAYYQYRGGQRSRKLVVKQGGVTEERIYLGNFEIYRNFVESSLNLERKTVHISDDTGRIAMYEYRTIGWDNSPQELMRYIYSNNLSSAMLELDDTGQIISYEEYHPFGTTAYQATNSAINAVAKRYRYTGKERDEESGLYYHGARYYIPWLCRWTQCDPIGIKDGLNVYAYCSNNPVILHDPSGTSGNSPEEKSKSGEVKSDKSETLSAENSALVKDIKSYLTSKSAELEKKQQSEFNKVVKQLKKESAYIDAKSKKEYEKNKDIQGKMSLETYQKDMRTAYAQKLLDGSK